ncbi:MAG TPA: glycoside hydrolase family 3 C-terminal domain-containing protein [Terracidiphilus sp.]|nr:glycoside hydrolase family 3 C-terminal domain-containing protein [Terracidiphilus sp.]
MRTLSIRFAAAAFACCGLIACAAAQETAKPASNESGQPAYLNTKLAPEVRAADLVKRLTLQEKASQLTNYSRAVPRLNIPSYDWWSEALHGVATQGVTEYPEPIGLAATFDPDTIHQMASQIGVEGRIKHQEFMKQNGGFSNIFQGLDFWAPNINIFRDPRWGRGQETYGEDPYLTGRMAVAYVTGMQGDDPHYYRAISTPKHYAVHSGPEPDRHRIDVVIDKHDELDTYLPAFRAAITEGKAGSIMCAYNSVNNDPACASPFLLEDQLRGHWNFKGYVVSDCGAVTDIYENHNYTPNQPAGSAISLKRGMDNECVDFGVVKDDHDYKPYLDAVKIGYLKESDIDVALVRLYTARMRLGMFDPPEMDPYSKIDPKELDSAEHRATALKLANESLVLLKNDGTLPLKTSGVKIAVIGPLADQTAVLLGNYNGRPNHTVSILDGIKNEFSGADIKYVAGTSFLGGHGDAVPADLVTNNGKPGVNAMYMSGLPFGGGQPKILLTRSEPAIDASAKALPSEAANASPLMIRWTGTFTAPDSGEYQIGMEANGFFRLTLDGKAMAMNYQADEPEQRMGRIKLVKGQAYALEAIYGPPEKQQPVAKLIWSKYDTAPSPEAVDAAKNADVVVAVVGITSRLEGEEMDVSEPGFKGGDRTSLDLPKPEQDLLEALSATGKPLVVVLTNGSALSVNWANQHANAILDAWYPGEEGGNAVAQTLSGKNDPSGRLPVTFYTSVSQLPPFENYFMANRTYRYFTGKPLYPFGYGLSYTTFSYSDLTLPKAAVAAGEPVSADVTVTNTGKVAGDEVAQLYLSFPDVKGAPLRALRAFKRVHLEAGASQKVHFELKLRDLSMVTEAAVIEIPGGKYNVSVGGGQPNTGATTVAGSFTVTGTKQLPE